MRKESKKKKKERINVMLAYVLGTEVVSYTSKKTNLLVSGISLHVAYKDPSVFGEAADKVFVSDNLRIRGDVEKVRPGMRVDLDTNFRGNVVGVKIVPDENNGTAGKPAK